VIRSILPATILSSMVISAAWALPVSPTSSNVNQLRSIDFVQIGDKKYYKENKKYYAQINTWKTLQQQILSWWSILGPPL
jgi:hypothetical protein